MDICLDIGALAQELGQVLREKKLTIGCGESCTGGLLTSTLTDVAGSSEYVLGSIVSYSNQVKMQQLGVKEATLEAFGAVSAETAREMASGVLTQLHSDIGISVTGIAGPGGGTAQKPVGLVYICVAGPKGLVVAENHFSGDRNQVKRQTVAKAISMALAYVKDF